MHRLLKTTALAAALLAAGCATVRMDEAVSDADRRIADFTQGRLELSRTAERQQARSRLTDQLLAEPVAVDGAVQIALANSPSLQALLADAWSDLAAANQSGRIANPVFTFERLRLGSELELGRLFSVGLLELITLPQRRAIAQRQQEQAKLQLASSVVDQVSRVRQAWCAQSLRSSCSATRAR